MAARISGSIYLEEDRFMKKFMAGACTLVFVMSVTVLAQEPEWNPARVKECDRPCLVNIVDGYMNAIFKHDPKAVPPLSKDIRVTENTAEIGVGEGVLWRSKVEPTGFKIHVADPVAGQVAIQNTPQDTGARRLGRSAIEDRSRKDPGNRATLRPQCQRSGNPASDDSSARPSERRSSQSAQVPRVHDLGSQFLL